MRKESESAMSSQAFNISRFQAVLLVLLLLGGCTQIEIDRCLDAGGRWVEETGECECTYEDRGNFNTQITEEELRACMKPRPQKKGQESEGQQ